MARKKLAAHQAKRDFKNTPEPSGRSKVRRAEYPRFVIQKHAAAVAPLSPRGRPGATVSMPLSWSQVRDTLDPMRFTIRTAPALVAKSRAWSEYCDSEQPLAQAIRKLARGKK